jgi:hypothetical protein
MNYNIKLKSLKLKEKESEIERASYELARSIFATHIPYDLRIPKRDNLFRTIEDVKQKYRELFSFDLYHSELRRLDGVMSDIRDWVATEYKTQGDCTGYWIAARHW